jgi:dCMP deaminase
MMGRISKVEGWLEVARAYGLRSPCSRRKFGAVIVKNGVQVGSGYNGTARGCYNCGIDVPCIKDVANEPTNISYEYCPAIHAEQNAIINSNPQDRVGATMYLAPAFGLGDRPCYKCRRFMINAQIKDVYYINGDNEIVHEMVFDGTVVSRDGVIIHITPSYVDMENKWIEDKLDESNPDWKEECI